MIDRHRGVEEQLDTSLQDYYLERIRLHLHDSYVGVRMIKFPEDLRTYEQLLWEERVDVVVEIGLRYGGSALWFRDRLRTLAHYGRISSDPLVISVDVDIARGRENLARVDPGYAETIRLVEADVRDPLVVAQVHQHLPEGARVLLIDDSAHRYDTTIATLRQFSSLVPVSGYVVVEDGHRDLPDMMPFDAPGQAHGVLAAIDDWLASGGAGRFVRRREQERYIVTSNPRGWLQRVR
jgi:cephalosporin hydroxylase